MEFGDILRQIRAERGLSQDELAALLGTTKQVISRYETKKRVPRLSVVTAFAQSSVCRFQRSPAKRRSCRRN
ncbi:MAG: helix-turn-helix domain-containing protein [Christensenellales bacterium]